MTHPLHPALVHFPIATWSLATLSDAAGLVPAAGAWSEPLWRFAGITLAIGTITALPAMGAGFVDFLKLTPEHPAERDAQRHMLWVMAAWCCYAASLFLRFDGSTLIRPNLPALALSAGGFVALGVAGWLGGRLVYAHGLGAAPRQHALERPSIQPLPDDTRPM